jgi:hypothetical protein
MRIPGVLATACVAMLLLSSCAPSTTTSAPQTTPSPTASMPTFLHGAQSGSDRLPDDVTTRVDVDATSSRYQGQWDGREIYLAVKKGSSVCLVTGIFDTPESWVADGVVSSKFSDGDMVKYLPMASAVTPQGWTRVSDYVFAM